MKTPAYWSKATVEELDRDGRKIAQSCWRSSDTSVEAAHESALTEAKRILQNFLSGQQRGRYGYGELPLREDVVQRITNSQGELLAAVTQNSYGSLVLNTAQVMFIDLDFAPIKAGESIRHFFGKLFGKSSMSPQAEREQDAHSRLEQFVRDNSQFSVRAYRTCAGMRALATHGLFDPTAGSTRSLLQSVGTDPLYVKLCKSRECFRARLTPKPWRCGHTPNTVAWPRESEDQRARFAKWQSAYTAKQSEYATCRFVDTIGTGQIHPDIESIIEVHDHVTRCNERLNLA